jgi:AcrR family transcriptional regulator
MATALNGTPDLDDERRSELLDQLEQVVLDRGFVGVTLDDFAASLHCSKSTLYRLAPSKDRLVSAITRHFFISAAQRIETAVETAVTPTEKLQVYLAMVGREMGRGSPLFHEQMASHPLTAKSYRRNSEIAAERVRGLIDDGVRSGEFTVADPDFAGRAVATLMNAIHLQDGGVVAHGDAERAHARLGELLLYGVLGARE